MLVIGSELLNYPVMSLHVGGEVARTDRAIINPDGLKVVAYTLSGPLVKSGQCGDILEVSDIREYSSLGLIIDSSDNFVRSGDVINLDRIISLNFNLVGLKVVSQDGKKIGKVADYTVDSATFAVYQIIVQRPLIKSLLDPELTINRSQIVEIDDYKITVRHEYEQVSTKKERKEFVPNFVNPFREPNYSSDSSSTSDEDNSSEISA